MLIFIAIIAIAVLLYFNNSVKKRNIDRSNRLAEKHKELMQMLKEKKTHEDNARKA